MNRIITISPDRGDCAYFGGLADAEVSGKGATPEAESKDKPTSGGVIG